MNKNIITLALVSFHSIVLLLIPCGWTIHQTDLLNVPFISGTSCDSELFDSMFIFSSAILLTWIGLYLQSAFLFICKMCHFLSQLFWADSSNFSVKKGQVCPEKWFPCTAEMSSPSPLGSAMAYFPYTEK